MKAYCNGVEIEEKDYDKYVYVKHIATDKVEVRLKNNQEKIYDLKQKLAESDYKAIKYAEGEIEPADYAPIRAARQEWRRQINELESQS